MLDAPRSRHVIEEGEIGVGDIILKIASGPVRRMTVSFVNRLLYGSVHPLEHLEAAASLEALSPGWKESYQSMLDKSPNLLGNVGLSPMKLQPIAWPGFKPLRVVDIFSSGSSIKIIEFEDRAGRDLPGYVAGQHIVLRIPTRDGNIFRSYSLAGDSSNGRYRIGVKKVPNGIAGAYLHDEISAGDEIYCSAPRGTFRLIDPISIPLVLIGAGIGITPLLGMLHFATRNQLRTAPIWWVYGARNSQSAPLNDEVRELLEISPTVTRYTAYSRPLNEDRLGVDYDFDGHIKLSELQKSGVPKQAEFYLCGPEPVLRQLISDLRFWGVDSAHIHVESFGAEGTSSPALASTPTRVDGTGPIVTFLKSNKSARWDEKYASLLELAEASNVSTTWSCRAGVCHRCETSLIGGEVAYDPDPIDLPPVGTILICCSRPRTDAQLDL
ncbi:ferredoxin-NADP reductase [Phyllobacterium trifolii]|uniref:Ferredoxin-NADP reductase n=1 Tax=Phyllobacterium trifolii TaxID=300193 RepID=A0A839UF05_9HYPH|nr:FAD-binding oxidoreductase [Phyllobacterium trifolii]MBB3148525.1 ferredoxin-NADP reductase [Phyllobacterium trifolii]